LTGRQSRRAVFGARVGHGGEQALHAWASVRVPLPRRRQAAVTGLARLAVAAHDNVVAAVVNESVMAAVAAPNGVMAEVAALEGVMAEVAALEGETVSVASHKGAM
jgi:hypothetical protein